MSELHRFTAGDLSQQAAANLQSHLRDCSACATQLHSWDQTLEAYRRHAPGARESLPRWDGFDKALHREEVAWHSARATRTRRQWAAAAAIVVTVLGSAWFWQRTEAVLSAEAVITRAVQQEQENPLPIAAAVWIRETGASAVGSGGAASLKNVDSTKVSEVMSSRGRVGTELATRLAAYGFSWTMPLSARPLQRWRATAERPQDIIQLIDPVLLKISTSTTAGTIRHVEIVVRQHTYEPVSQHWRFADGLEVELTSVEPDKPAPTPPVVVAAAPESVKPAAPPVDIEAAELDLRSTVQRLGAPVGSGLMIRQVGGKLRIEGIVSTSETARQVAVYARRHRLVDARVAVDSDAAHREVVVSTALRAWLDQAFADARLREAFAARTWELLDDLSVRVTALEELAGRYNEDRAAALSTEARQLLTDLAAQQYAGLTTNYEALERQIAPLIGTISRPVLPSELPAKWRRVGAPADDAIGELITGLQAVFGVPHSDTTPDDFVQHARHLLRPALESLATRIAPP